jgi:copper(I)-binding protein
VTRPRTRTGLVVLPVVAAGLLLSGCGAGLHAQVYEPRDQGDSVNVTTDTLAVRHVFVSAPRNGNSYAKGSDADLRLTVVNRKSADDALVSATSPVASSVEVDGGQLDLAGFSSSPVDSTLVLTGLTEELQVADYVRVVLTFRSGSTVTQDAPVAQDPDAAPSPDPSFHVPDVDSDNKVVTEAPGAE